MQEKWSDFLTDYLIVDGYNIINAWTNLKQTAEESLEISRLELIEELAKFKNILWKQIIVVFDAHLTKEKKRHTEESSGVMVIFTQEGETADSLIEALVYELVTQGNVEVATSDWQEQRVILGKGAARLSARNLKDITNATTQRIRKRYINKDDSKNTLGNLLDERMKEKLNSFRQSD
ncbi:NYN domain-containing protein [Natranaerobius trueperi]|uniref:NYN domain-containing protein n=1 Tax=Natranaerobius trueperi TaxID=759412 RepID=UPI0013031D65|nr:NYN domain-containing protein [Natranaerobius trueperi]